MKSDILDIIDNHIYGCCIYYFSEEKPTKADLSKKSIKKIVTNFIEVDSGFKFIKKHYLYEAIKGYIELELSEKKD
ncbi:MAG: hypothetical protein JEZ05_08285 [Tenericutes bacterium]|nr:hypothetical protein [Mycoplasmatota bacterium]